MTREQRRKQLHGRIYIFCLILVTMTVFIIFMLSKSETYAIESNSNTHYKYVTEYTQKATYIGSGNFIDENGNEWAVNSDEYKKGKQYTLLMHDNGTENIITDDVIVDIY
jgi:hypothetical protein